MRWILIGKQSQDAHQLAVNLAAARLACWRPGVRGDEIEIDLGPSAPEGWQTVTATGADARAAWQAIRGLAAAGGPPADQLGPAVLAAVAEIRRIASLCTPRSQVSSDLYALANRLVHAAGDGKAER